MSIATATAETTTAETAAQLAARLWGKADVARIFRVSESTIKRWIEEGRLPTPVKIGHRVLWPAEAITELATVGTIKGRTNAVEFKAPAR